MIKNLEQTETAAIEKALTTVADLVKSDQPINGNFTNEDLSILYSLAFHLYEAGDNTQALMIFRQLVLSKPMEKKYWQGLAAVLQVENNFDEALVGWSMTALIDNTDPAPHFHAAECLISREEIDEALKALQAAKERLDLTDEEHMRLKFKIDQLDRTWSQEACPKLQG